MKNKLINVFLILLGFLVSAQADPALEIVKTSGSVIGPVQTYEVNFLQDTQNPTNITSGTVSPFIAAPYPLKMTLSISNSQFPNAVTADPLSKNALNLAYSLGTTSTNSTLVTGGNGSLPEQYTYAGYATPGTGINPNGSNSNNLRNTGVPLFISTTQFAYTPNQRLTNAKVYMGDLTVTFDRPVNNPVLHFAGLGGAKAFFMFKTSFELIGSSVALSKLSGMSYFDVTSNVISNNSNLQADVNSGNGSVLVTGRNITSISFKIFLKGSGLLPLDGSDDAPTGYTSYNSWSADNSGSLLPNDGQQGDFSIISASLGESDLAVTKAVDKTNPAIGTLVNFTVTATNNGMSQSPNTTVTDLLPAGYTYSSNTTSAGTYDSATGVWSIGTLAIGASATMNIAAYVKNTGPYLNTATIAGDNTDPVATNNTATATVTPVVPPIFTCNDGRAYVSQVYPTDATTTILTYINPTTGAYANIGSTSGILYNSMGYNPVDNYLYALRIEGSVGTPGPNMSHLLRIDANGAAYDLGPIPGLPIGSFLQATFDTSGNMYVPRVPGLADTKMYIINVASLTQTSVAPSPAAVNSSDVVYASDGKLYMVINEKGLVSMTTGGAVTPIGLQTYAGSFGSMFADALGNLYGVLNSTVGALPGSGTGVGDPNGGLYQIDKATGVRLKILNIPFPGNHDGASCINANYIYPASLSISKTDGVTAYTAGGTTTYTIVASNTGSSGVMNATVTDALPAGITAMSYTAVASTGSSTSVPIAGSTGAINDVVNLLAGGTVTYTVTVNIPATFTGDLVNTAVITPPSNVTDADGSANNTATDTDINPPCVITASNPDSDGDGISNACDLDDDNDGILDTAECATANNLFLTYSNVDYKGTINNASPNNIATAQDSTGGGGLTRSLGGVDNYMLLTGIDATTEAQAITNNEYVEYSVTTNSKSAFITQLGYYSANIGATGSNTNYHFTARVSKDSFTTNTLLNNDYAYTPSQGHFTIPVVQNNYLLEASTTYKVRVYFFNVTGGSSAKIAHDDFKILGFVECDADGDGIPNRLDLDSDNDGCPDAVEGGATFALSQLVPSVGSLKGGNGVDPAVTPTSGTYSQAVLQNLPTPVGNGSTTNGVPTIAGSGQTVGTSQDSAVKAAVCLVCYNTPTNTTASVTVNHGITLLKRAGADNNNWPMNRNSAYTVLESNTKGFVITRIPTTGFSAITNPVEGMMVYDTTAKCLKIYADSVWSCFSTPTCP